MKRIAFSIIIAVAIFAGAAVAQNGLLTIENTFLAAHCDQTTATFRLVAKPAQRSFLRGGQFPATGGEARVSTVTDKTFGPGQAIEITTPDGRREAIMLFPNLPFALFRSSLSNTTDAASITRQIRPFSALVEIGLPASKVKTLGTGGLLAPAKNPGSYVWLAMADPATRRGVVSGWLTHERGSGIVFSKVEGEQLRLEPQIDYGRLRLEPGQSEDLETFAVGFFDDARLGLEVWADAVARVYDNPPASATDRLLHLVFASAWRRLG